MNETYQRAGDGSRLIVVTYHYVRDFATSRFPALRGAELSDFVRQVDAFRDRWEMATVESALAFLAGRYQPRRDMCLLTFDDGLEEHGAVVTPVLAERGVQGVFSIITACPEAGFMPTVHQSHLLTADLGFDEYRRRFLDELALCAPEIDPDTVDMDVVRHTYRWGPEDERAFKYLVNFVLSADLSAGIVNTLYRQHFGTDDAVAREFFLGWDAIGAMREAGMAIGGHSHRHETLSLLDDAILEKDLTTCRRLLDERLGVTDPLPFCIPYGKSDSFNRTTVALLDRLGFCTAFTTEVGTNAPDTDPYAIRRLDPKDVPA